MPISKHKKIRARARNTIDHQLGALFDNTEQYKICMLDKSGRILGWSASAERMTGYKSEEVLGKEYSMFMSKEEIRSRLLKNILAAATKKGEFNAEGIRLRKDGTHFWARSVITPVKGHNGSIQFFAVITKNVTEEREFEQKREEYIGIASHELKNPITTLSLYSEILANRLQLQRDRRNLSMLRDIQGQAARLTALVDDLLIVGKIEGGTLELNKETFDPNAFVAGIIRHFQSAHPSHNIKQIGRVARHVRADKGRIAQVLINLLTNAVKYSPVSNIVQVRMKRTLDTCIISVQDFGPGIEKKDFRDIFTRFFRAVGVGPGNAAGSGLGLYISREIIKRHRERLWVESSVGKGSTFSFTLPLKRE